MTARADATSPTSPPALIIGLDCITGLQTARILWQRGVPVIGISSERGHFSTRSRATRRVVYAPTSGEPLMDRLRAIGPQLRERAVLFPCTDAAVATIARGRDELRRWFHVPLADEETVLQLLDKARFEAWAADRGYPIPRTIVLNSRADALRAGAALQFPAVVKPGIKSTQWQRFTKAKVLEAPDPDALLEIYDIYSPHAESLTAQEWIVGPESELYSCNAYFDVNARPLATFVARKLRQWPPRTGTSCLGEEVRNDIVLETTQRLFSEAGFHGLAYLEMKRDIRTGRHYVIEPNVGRPTGRSAIAEAGGVELIMTAYCDAIGTDLPPERTQKYGDAKWMYLRNDALSAFHYWRAGDLTVRAWRKSLRGRKVDAVWSRHDPMPFVADLAASAAKIARVARRYTGPSRRLKTPAEGAGAR